MFNFFNLFGDKKAVIHTEMYPLPNYSEISRFEDELIELVNVSEENRELVEDNIFYLAHDVIDEGRLPYEARRAARKDDAWWEENVKNGSLEDGSWSVK